MVAKLITHQLRRRTIVTLRLRLHQADALLVIHEVHCLTLQFDVIAIALELAENLKSAKISSLRLTEAALPFGDFSHALTSSVVNIKGRLGDVVGWWSRIDGLARSGAQLILEVPLHQSQVRHAGHVAVGVVVVIF